MPESVFVALACLAGVFTVMILLMTMVVLSSKIAIAIENRGKKKQKSEEMG